MRMEETRSVIHQHLLVHPRFPLLMNHCLHHHLAHPPRLHSDKVPANRKGRDNDAKLNLEPKVWNDFA